MANKTVFDLRQEGVLIDLVVVLESKWDPQYKAACTISNSLYVFRPSGVAYCKNEIHVRHCLNFCRDNKIGFRIRSGGHQHEGMCIADNVLVIDLSEIRDIRYNKEKTTAWIPSGKQLRYVYSELEEHKRTIAGGGCPSVNVGGLTLGGGWGVSSRYLGLTCDNILAAEVILANGNIVEANGDEDNPYKDLFWAIRGGGGGNFGIVTRFKFKLIKLEGTITSFAFTFTENVNAVTKTWVKIHLNTKLSNALSSRCVLRLQAPTTSTNERPSVSAGLVGQFYGTKKDLLDILNPFFQEYPVVKTRSWINERHFPTEQDALDTFLPNGMSLADSQTFLADFLPTASPSPILDTVPKQQQESRTTIDQLGSRHISPKVNTPPPVTTCNAPHPHKVTSCFPKDFLTSDGTYKTEKYFELVDKIIEYMEGEHSTYAMDASQYINFHSLGGAIKELPKTERGAFSFYEKPFMFQMQSWWNFSENARVDNLRAEIYVAWVENFRKYLLEIVEGAFINFVDYKLVANPSTSEGKLELLKIYYQDNLDKLQAVKSEFDEDDLFHFRMSIPPK